MDKKSLSERQKVTDITAIETDPDKLLAEAKTWAKALWKTVKRQTDAKEDAAMVSAARLAGVTPGTLWKLKYRPPKKLDVAIYNRLKLAHLRYVKSPEATVAENLAVLRALPADPKTARLLASLEEYLRDQEGEETRPPAQPTIGG